MLNKKHLIESHETALSALKVLNDLHAADAILLVTDKSGKLLASLTDGDIRRGIIRGLKIEQNLMDFTQQNCIYLREGENSVPEMRKLRDENYRIIPIIDKSGKITDIINFRLQKSYLPIDAVIMAGGLGSRLRPLTDKVPKPMLIVGDKPIVEHNIDRLKDFGVKNITLSVKYLAEQLIDYFTDGRARNLNINYVYEDEPRGTIGAVSEVEHWSNDYVLVMNSDLLTNIDFEEMFALMLEQDADMIVATVPYEVKVPYGVIETDGELVANLVEKPTYTYYSNAGIYIIKRAHIDKIPKTDKYNATDLMEHLYKNEYKVTHFAILDYWLDIGKMADFEKAQKDVKHIKF